MVLCVLCWQYLNNVVGSVHTCVCAWHVCLCVLRPHVCGHRLSVKQCGVVFGVVVDGERGCSLHDNSMQYLMGR